MSLIKSKRKRSELSPGQEIGVDDGHPFSQVTGVLEIPEGEEAGPSTSTESDEEELLPEFDAASDTDSDAYTSEADFDEGSATQEIRLFPRAQMDVSSITGQLKRVYPEIEPDYDSDSSTEEDPNRVGNVPMHWYDDLPHIGYNIDGKKVLRPATKDELDKFLSTVEDPTSWTTAFDEKSQMEKALQPEELDIIRRLQQGEIPDANYNPYEPTVEWFTGEGKQEAMPLSAAPEPKRRWIPSKWEKQKVMKIVRAIRQGRIVSLKPKATADSSPFYNLWSSETSTPQSVASLPAPRRRLPTNAESYNPPPEYLPTDKEREQWEQTDPEDRERDYLPQAYSSLRLVPAYDQFIKERFNRQLDLYLAPRVQRKRLNLDAESLMPKLPSPDTLRPFPQYKALRISHKSRVRCISLSPDGVWSVTGDEAGNVTLWEVAVGYPVKQWSLSEKIAALAWCPRRDVSYFMVATASVVEAIIPPSLPFHILHATRALLAPVTLPTVATESSAPLWHYTPSSDSSNLTIRLPPGFSSVKQIVYHGKGDYVASVSDGDGGQSAVWIHQISKRQSQNPFRKIKGAVQKVLFHPTKALFFVATQRYVRMYDLVAQKLVKTLQPGIKWISSMDIHPSGEHLIVGGYDRKLCWFDLELSDKPYKILRYHSRAIREVCFHPTYPLFASCSDDGTIQIFHARVYHDLMTDPLIVPLKILRGHTVTDGLGVLDIRWCARTPWLVSGGADGDAAVWFS